VEDGIDCDYTDDDGPELISGSLSSMIGWPGKLGKPGGGW